MEFINTVSTTTADLLFDAKSDTLNESGRHTHHMKDSL